MKITLTKEIMEALKGPLAKKPWNISAERRRYNDTEDIDLAEHNDVELSALETHLETVKHVKGVPVVIRDIRTWMKARAEGVDGVKVRKCQQAPSLLRAMFLKANRRHVYTTAPGEVDASLLPYYVTGIEWFPKRYDDRDTEHVRIETAYEVFGRTVKKNFRIEAGGCIGKTPQQILQECGLVLETDEIRRDYLHQRARFHELRDRIGMQVLCTGEGSVEDVDEFTNTRSSWDRYSITCEKNGQPARCVLDVFRESDRSNRNRHEETVYSYYWRRAVAQDARGNLDYVGPEEEDVQTEDDEEPEVLTHPYLVVFDLGRHTRYAIHVAGVTPYIYETGIRKKLTLPPDHAAVLDTLLSERPEHFVDIIKNKAGGTVILCQGPPGTGKTLTAEVYAETLRKPLYSVQCSQLGVKADEVEEMLMGTLERGKRWNAVMLLDEADVYITKRGTNLTQNAIVGVFLRVLEYHAGLLFLTTNRGDLVDDAILSRCTARIEYGRPDPAAQAAIWTALSTVNGHPLHEKTVQQIVKDHPMSGRDIKNVLKLCLMVAHDRKIGITTDLVAEMKRFKPTVE